MYVYVPSYKSYWYIDRQHELCTPFPMYFLAPVDRACISISAEYICVGIFPWPVDTWLCILYCTHAWWSSLMYSLCCIILSVHSCVQWITPHVYTHIMNIDWIAYIFHRIIFSLTQNYYWNSNIQWTVQIKCNNDLSSFQLCFFVKFVLNWAKTNSRSVKLPVFSISHFVLKLIMAKTGSTAKVNSPNDIFSAIPQSPSSCQNFRPYGCYYILICESLIL